MAQPVVQVPPQSEPRGKHGKKNKKGGKVNKLKGRIERMISKTESLKAKKYAEIDSLSMQQRELEDLLKNADSMEFYAVKDAIKSIVQSRKMRNKSKRKGKGGGRGRGGRGGRGRGRGRGKGGRGRNKGKNKQEFAGKEDAKKAKQEQKEAKRAEKLKRKQAKKAAREERRRLKEEKIAKLEAARFASLPSNKTEIGNQSTLNLYVDGYNILGCDPLCRRNNRGRGKLGKGRKRLEQKLQDQFLNDVANQVYGFDYNIRINLWFDGNGRNHQYKDVDVVFSTKQQIVDDKLVELFSKNTVSENANNFVVTTDRELTLRLHEIGVKVIKSSVFWKTYLVKEDNENQNDEEVKAEEAPKDDDETKEEETDAVFVKFCAQKMNSVVADVTDDLEDDTDDDGTPDEGEDDYDIVQNEDGEDDYDDELDDDDDHDEFDEVFADELNDMDLEEDD